MNRQITSNKKIPTNKIPGPDAFTREYYQIFRQELTPILLQLLQKISEKGVFLRLESP